MQIKFLPAFNGDCILLKVEENGTIHNILIDGGTPRTYYKHLKNELVELVQLNQQIDLLVTTHIDDDHIGGLIKLFEDRELDKGFIKEVWFNAGKQLSTYFNENVHEDRAIRLLPTDQTLMSVDQGDTLEAELDKLKCWKKELIIQGNEFKFGELKLTILSPNERSLKALNKKWETESSALLTMSSEEHDDFEIPISELIKRPFKEDKAVPNGSSVAILAEVRDKSILLLADAHPSIVIEALEKLGWSSDNKLKVDLVKISHHASKGNTNKQLLELIQCDSFIVSTDGSRHGLPDKESLARIVGTFPACTIYFNYRNEITQAIFFKKDREDFPSFTCKYLEDTAYTIEL